MIHNTYLTKDALARIDGARRPWGGLGPAACPTKDRQPPGRTSETGRGVVGGASNRGHGDGRQPAPFVESLLDLPHYHHRRPCVSQVFTSSEGVTSWQSVQALRYVLVTALRGIGRDHVWRGGDWAMAQHLLRLVMVLTCTISVVAQGGPQRQGRPTTGSQRRILDAAVQRLGQTPDPTGAGYGTAGRRLRDKIRNGHITAENLGPGNYALTLPDRGTLFIGGDDGNEVVIQTGHLTDGSGHGQYSPPGLGSDPPRDAQEIALASLLFHEYQHCVQDIPSASSEQERLRLSCLQALHHVTVIDMQISFVLRSLQDLASKGLLTPSTEAALNRWIRLLFWLRDIANQRYQLIKNNC